MVYAFRNMTPVVHPTAFVHPQATLVGHVTVGPDCYVGPHAVLRGDWGKIVLDRGSNVQEGCVIHMFPGKTVHLHEGAHVGHGAKVHGATLGRNCMIGINAVILDGAVIGDECIVGALALVKANSIFERRSLVLGQPASVKGEVSDAMIAHKTEGTTLYQRLPADCQAQMKEVEPLTEVPSDRVEDFPVFDTWQKRKTNIS
tara:strand:+ start:32134 stop:32736 length:603 start_codon:yes stop_codon:yes gene_type:complete